MTGRKIKRLTDDEIFDQMVGIYKGDEVVAQVLRYLVLREEVTRRHGTWGRARARMNEFLHKRNLAAAALPEQF